MGELNKRWILITNVCINFCPEGRLTESPSALAQHSRGIEHCVGGSRYTNFSDTPK